MSGDSIDDLVDAYLHEQADRPFGDIELASGRTLSPFSRAGMAAADNLLAKASLALAAGDVERVGRFVHRAVELPYDRHEETEPAALAAHMMLYNAISDAVEISPEGDARWLDAAALALSSTKDGWGRSEMRRVLLIVGNEYPLDRRERRTIQNLVSGVIEHVELADAALSAPELVEAVTSVLQILQAYRSALPSSAPHESADA